jgi:hypothetical protein
MPSSILCLAALLVVPCVDAAPAPASGRKAKEKLEALKQRLPAVLETWVKERSVGYPDHCKPMLRWLCADRLRFRPCRLPLH